MVTQRRKTGDMGESVAAQFLERKGFKILERNFLRPWGEIDLIAERAGEVHFIEVKTISRDTSKYVTREKEHYQPEEMAHARKLQKVARTAEMYMENKGDGRDFQLDVVTVILDKEKRRAICKLYEQVL